LGDSLLIYGFAKMVDDTTSGIIQWIGLDGGIGKLKKYRTANNLQSAIYDLSPLQGKMAYVSFNRQKNINNGSLDSRLIAFLDLLGKPTSHFDYDNDNGTSIYFPMSLAISNSEHVIFTAWQANSVPFGGDTPQLVFSTILGEVKWTYDWPSDLIESKEKYTISDLATTKNGDIIGCGYIFRGWYDGYIFRMNNEGKMIWERRYNIKDSLDEKLDAVFLNTVSEDIEGNIIASGSHTNSLSFNDEVILIKTNADGCVHGLGCAYRNILEDKATGVVNLTNNPYLTLSPNPFTEEIKITSEGRYDHFDIDVFDIMGKSIWSQKAQNHTLSISTLAWTQGLYIIKLSVDGVVLKTEKMVRI
jgi:hypothetical protein